MIYFQLYFLSFFYSIDTSLGGLIYSNRFIQFATNLASNNVYGLGENYHTSFKHDFHYQTYPLFAMDRPMGEVSCWLLLLLNIITFPKKQTTTNKL